MVSNDGQNLIFILSLPRSGSTLLGAILGNHSQISCPPEPWFLLRLREIIGNSSLPKIYDDHWASVGTRCFIPQEAFIECARSFALSAYNEHLRGKRCNIMVDKTPRYYHIIDFIELLFPKAIKIWLMRDPLDVAASYKSAWAISSDEIVGRKIEPHSFDFILGLHVLSKFFEKDSPYKYRLRYEDMVADPCGTIARLCDFSGIQFEQDMVNYGNNDTVMESLSATELGDKYLLAYKSAHIKSIGKWKETLSVDEIKDIIDVIGVDIFLSMGYQKTIRTIMDDYSLKKMQSNEDLDRIRASLMTTYNSGVLFSWEKEILQTLKDNTREQHNRFQAEFDAVVAERDTISAERDQVIAQRNALSTERDQIAAERFYLAACRDQMLNSLSWRLTAPLRFLGKFFMKG